MHPVASYVYRPVKELKGYEKVLVKAGKKNEVAIVLDKSAFAYYSVAEDGWKTEDGVYEILIGASSKDIRLCAKVKIEQGKFIAM